MPMVYIANESSEKRRDEWKAHGMELLKALEDDTNDLYYALRDVFSLLSKMCFLFSASKGFHDNYVPFPEFISLTHSELSEALEAYRHNNPQSNHVPEFTGIEEELADVLYRIFDRVGAEEDYGVFQLKLAEAFVAKARFNAERPFKHGKVC